jgi:hypothetical protein
MSSNNLVHGPIPAKDMQQLENHLKGMMKILSAFKVDLNADDKKRMPKASDKTYTFINKCLGLMKSHPEFLTGMMDPNEASNDKKTQEQANVLKEETNIVVQLLHDLAIAAGSEAYSVALDYYQSVKRYADKGDASAVQLADDLGKLFRKSSSSDEPDDEQETSEY